MVAPCSPEYDWNSAVDCLGNEVFKRVVASQDWYFCATISCLLIRVPPGFHRWHPREMGISLQENEEEFVFIHDESDFF